MCDYERRFTGSKNDQGDKNFPVEKVRSHWDGLLEEKKTLENYNKVPNSTSVRARQSPFCHTANNKGLLKDKFQFTRRKFSRCSEYYTWNSLSLKPADTRDIRIQKETFWGISPAATGPVNKPPLRTWYILLNSFHNCNQYGCW